jgi:hypothetical protein
MRERGTHRAPPPRAPRVVADKHHPTPHAPALNGSNAARTATRAAAAVRVAATEPRNGRISLLRGNDEPPLPPQQVRDVSD